MIKTTCWSSKLSIRMGRKDQNVVVFLCHRSQGSDCFQLIRMQQNATVTTHRFLKKMGYSSRRSHPHQVLLILSKLENWGYNSHRLTKTGQQNRNTQPSLMSLGLSCNIHIVRWEFGMNNNKAWIHLPWINTSGFCCWCNVAGDIFLAHFGQLSNWVMFKHHNLPDYCYWLCLCLYDHSIPIFW